MKNAIKVGNLVQFANFSNEKVLKKFINHKKGNCHSGQYDYTSCVIYPQNIKKFIQQTNEYKSIERVMFWDSMAKWIENIYVDVPDITRYSDNNVIKNAFNTNENNDCPNKSSAFLVVNIENFFEEKHVPKALKEKLGLQYWVYWHQHPNRKWNGWWNQSREIRKYPIFVTFLHGNNILYNAFHSIECFNMLFEKLV